MTTTHTPQVPDALSTAHIAQSTQGEHTTGGKKAPKLGGTKKPVGTSNSGQPGLTPQGNALGMLMGGFAVAAPVLAELQAEMLKILQEDGELAHNQIGMTYEMADNTKSAAIAQGNLEGSITQQDMIASFASAGGALLGAATMMYGQVKSTSADRADNAEETNLDKMSKGVEDQYSSANADVVAGPRSGSSGDGVTPDDQAHIEKLKRGNFGKEFAGSTDSESKISDEEVLKKISSKSDLDEIKSRISKRKDAIEKRRSARLTKLQQYSAYSQTISQVVSGGTQGITKNNQIDMQEAKGLETGVQQQAQFLQGQSDDVTKKFEQVAETQKQNIDQLNNTAQAMAGNNSA